MRRLPATLLLPLAFSASFLLGLWVGFFAERLTHEGRVLPRVAACGQPLADLRAADLSRALHDCSQRLLDRPISLRLGEAAVSKSASELGVSIDWASLRKQALGAGRTGGALAQFGSWLTHLRTPIDLGIPVRGSREKLEKALAPWVRKQVPEPRSPRLVLSVPPTADYGQAGRALDVVSLEKQLLALVSTALSPPPVQGLSLGVPLRSMPLLVNEERVDAQLQLARQILSGPVTLTHPEIEDDFELRPQELATALLVRDEGPSEFTLEIEPGGLGQALAPWLARLEIPARNADFTFGPSGRVGISPSEQGRAVDLEVLSARILSIGQSVDRHIEVTLVSREPRLTTQQAEELGIKKLVASFTTVHKCCQPRVDNIHVAADRVDGTVLLPGETFSLNDALGPRTARAGYKRAPTIVHGEMQKTWGGGVSQFATTLFNAVLDGGYQVVQRQPHSFYFPRYPEGHEATVSFPEPDLIFKNDTDAGLVIKTQYSGTFIKVLLYGDNGGRRVRRERSKRYDIQKPKVVYEADESIDPEKPKRLFGGQLGWTVLVSRIITFADGKKTTQKREVVYRSRPMILRVHPCTIPEGEEGYTGEDCPEPEVEAEFRDEPREFEDVGYWEDPEGDGAHVLESED